MFHKIYFLHWINTANEIHHHSEKSMNSEKKFYPGSKMNGLELTDVQMDQFMYMYLECHTCRSVVMMV